MGVRVGHSPRMDRAESRLLTVACTFDHLVEGADVVVVPRPASVGRAMAELMPMIGGVARAADALTAEERAAVTRVLGEVREVDREAAAGPAGHVASASVADPPAAR